MKSLLIKILVFSLFLTSHSQMANATHLMGGSFTYEYLDNNGPTGTPYRFKLKIQMFRDCYNSTTPFDNIIYVGIYYNNSSKSRLRVESINLTSETTVKPPSGGSQCSFEPNVCIKRGYYEKTINLPYSSTGFHLLHQRCCRNNLTNLVTNMGQSYYAFIPATSFKNNSPYFSGIPTPYVCAKDSVNISYAAVDPDGDSLAYRFVHPHAGGSYIDPAPYPGTLLNFPIDEVSFATSYSFAKPFGSTGYTNINSQTGLVSLMVPQAGLYAIAVEVLEYRNGKLLSTIRRDIELIVLNCPENKLPQLIIAGGITSFTIEEGEKLEFDIRYADKKDSMYLSRSGNLFGDPGTNEPPPYATLNTTEGLDTIKSSFSWKTSCSQGRSNPYFFTVKVKDNGCPPKERLDIFSIKVNPFVGPDSISGPKKVCDGDTAIRYKVYGLSKNSTVNWTVQGGNIIEGQGTDSVLVNWGKSGLGILRAHETSQYGCGPEAASYFVNIQPKPKAFAGNDTSICSRDSIIIGDPNADTSFTYIWFPGNSLNDSTLANPKFSFRHLGSSPVTKKLYLLVINQNNCINIDSINITVNPEPDTISISGPETPCFMGVFDYSVNRPSSSTFDWSVDGGTKMSSGNTRKASVLWTDTLSGKLHLVETNSFGCKGDTSHKTVQIVRPYTKIIGPDVVCPNTVNVEYRAQYTDGSTYQWNVYNGTFTQTGSGPLVKINWPDSGKAKITVVETTKEGCVGDTVDFPVTISYHLKTSEIFGDTNLCAFSIAEPYQVINTNGSHYAWTISGGSIASGKGENLIRVDWGKEGNAMLKVLETSYDSVNDKACIGDTVYQPVILNRLPNTSPISGPVDLCEFDTAVYSVTGFSSSVYLWKITNDSNISFNGQFNNTIEVYWQKQGKYHLTVLELTEDSCTNKLIDTFINIHPNPVTSEIFGDSAICFPNNTNITYQVNGFPSSDYFWNIESGTFLNQDGKSSISVEWLYPPSGKISVQEITEWGCIGEIKTKNIIIDSLSPKLNLVTTNIENEKDIEVHWAIVNDYHYNRKTMLYRGSPVYRSWELVDSFDKSQTSYIDPALETGQAYYNYIIAVENLCSDRFESPIHRSVLLQGEKTSDFEVSLKWNPYIGWENEVERYDLYRKINDDENYKLYRSLSTDTSAELTVGIDGKLQCYRVVAVKNGIEQLESWSNSACFEFEPVLHVPNAFTPNGDGINDSFFAHAYNLASYNMMIFDRWGEKVFSTTSTTEGWDGTFQGRKCPVGVYVVIIQYQGNTPSKSYKGNITLLR